MNKSKLKDKSKLILNSSGVVSVPVWFLCYYLKLEHNRWAISEQVRKIPFSFVSFLLLLHFIKKEIWKVSFDMKSLHIEGVNLRLLKK